MVREVKGIEKMGMLGAGRGARERGGRRLEVEVNAKRRSPGHDVSDLVLETLEESCAFGEDIVLVGLPRTHEHKHSAKPSPPLRRRKRSIQRKSTMICCVTRMEHIAIPRTNPFHRSIPYLRSKATGSMQGAS